MIKKRPADHDHSDGATMTRRSVIVGAAGSPIRAPSIACTSPIPVRSLLPPIERPHAGFCERLRYQFLESATRRGWNAERDGRVVGELSEIQAIESVTYARKNGWLPATTYRCCGESELLPDHLVHVSAGA